MRVELRARPVVLASQTDAAVQHGCFGVAPAL